MFRTSPYYYQVREEVYAEINYELSKELDLLQIQQDKGGNAKKSVSKSKQVMSSIFYKKSKEELHEDQIIKKCRGCDVVILSEDLVCSECNKIICQKCANDCSKCGNTCCLMCSQYQYLKNGDFIVCLQCQ